MRHWIVMTAVATAICLVAVPSRAAITPAQRKALNAIKADLGKITPMINRKKIDEAQGALNAAEARLDNFLQEEQIPDNEGALRTVRQMIEKQKTALKKATGKAGGKDGGDQISFTDAVAPVLAANCISCHSGNDPKGGLRLDTFAGMEQGGANGPLLVVGRPDDSLLMYRLLTPNPELRMPKNNDPLAKDDVAKITAWITAGAPFDGADKSSHLTMLEKQKPTAEITQATGNEKVSFTKDVAPGFVGSCLGCHNDNNRSGGLSMVTFAKLMQGGDSGAVLAPGKIDGSPLWKMVAEGDMPRGQARITRKWFDDLKTWIQEGCKFDGLDPKQRLAELIPSDQDKKMEELSNLSAEELVARRVSASLEQWKKTFPKTDARRIDSAEFLVLGDVSETRLKQIRDWAEGQLKSLKATFDVEKKPYFSGKLTIFVFKERFGYEEFNTTIHSREVPEDVLGHAIVTPVTQDEAFIALQDVGDQATDASPGMALNLMRQLTSAFLRRDARGELPDWLLQGTGLALGAKAGLGTPYISGQRKALGDALSKARLDKPEQIFESNSYAPSDLGAVGLGLVEFLIKRGGPGNFRLFLKQLQAGDSFAAALGEVYETNAQTLGTAVATAFAGAVRKSKK